MTEWGLFKHPLKPVRTPIPLKTSVVITLRKLPRITCDRNTESLGGAGSRASHTLNSRLVRGCSRLSSAQGSAADTWTQNARLRSCRALRACRYNSWGAIGDHARIFLASVPKRNKVAAGGGRWRYRGLGKTGPSRWL